MEEMLEQAQSNAVEFDTVLIASSSGGTQAGLVAGAWALGFAIAILGISIDESRERLQGHVASLASDTSLRASFAHTFIPSDILVDDNYLGGGYGVVGALEREAVRVMAQTEGILLDPVYTGRAFGALLDILRHSPERLGAGRPPRVLFWHTGGVPAIFAYQSEI
jgi:D-cysteine desulfhydrase